MTTETEPVPHKLGHEGTWCRTCDEGCGEEYGGVCDCCCEWSRDDYEEDS